jgi:hypothetical protein
LCRQTIAEAQDEAKPFRSTAAVVATQIGLQGRAVTVPEPEPWPDPVDGGQLLDDIAEMFRRFIVTRESRGQSGGHRRALPQSTGKSAGHLC